MNKPAMAATRVSLGQIFQPCRPASVDCRIHQERRGHRCNLHVNTSLCDCMIV